MKIKYGILFTFILTLTACQVQWVSLYDEQTDKNVTAYQKNMNIYFEKLKGLDWPQCSYDSNRDFYADALADATVILTRAQSIQNNDQTIIQTQSLKKNLEEVRETHRDSDEDQRCLSVDYVDVSQRLMNQTVRATLWLEQGKKRQFGKVEKSEDTPKTQLPAELQPN